MKRMTRLFYFLGTVLRAGLLAGLLAGGAVAQVADEGRISLVADDLQYDNKTKILIASGNVRILYRDQVLTTEKIIYYQAEARIEIPGPLILNYGEGSIVRARSAVVTEDLRNGLVKGAQVLINKQFQMATNELTLAQGRFKILNNSVASTCYICGHKGKVPFWQIRARRVVQDEQEKRIYFEDATLDFLGIPVLYTPYLRIPDPSVDRATGFLVPKFITSTTLGYGFKQPYYIRLGDHADATLTPFVTSIGGTSLEGQYRRKYKNGELVFDGAILLQDGLNANPFRSYLTGQGRFDLPFDLELNFGIDASSDKAFRADYGYGTQDRLTSFMTLEQTGADSFFSAGTSYIQSLRTNEIDKDIPFVFPEIYFRKTWKENLLGGRFGLTAQSVTLLRDANQTVARAGMSADWSGRWELPYGLVFGAFGQYAGNFYRTQNDPVFGNNTYSSATPTAAVELRWPWAARKGQVTHVIEPVMQAVWSPDSAFNTPNEDSVQVEFEESNLFSFNRFPGFDRTERGLRANIGISYWRQDPSGWNMGVTVGRVFRRQDLGQYSEATGLAGKVSDYVSTVQFSLPGQIDVVNRTLFDDAFNISKNETRIAYSFAPLTATASYVWLEEDVVSVQSEKRNEFSLAARYQLSDYWTYSAAWRYNIDTDRPTEGDFGVRYENECVAINLSLSLQYAASGIVRPTQELGLTIELAGLGNKKRNPRFAGRCKAI
jgi:LPS-assembly protein